MSADTARGQTLEMMDEMKAKVLSGGSFSLTVTGTSMAPFLKNGKSTVMIAPVMRSVRRGEIVFAEYPAGFCLLHRVWRIKSDGIYLNGDSRVQIEGPVPPDAIIGTVKLTVSPSGRCRRADTAYFRFFGRLWQLTRRMRPFLWRMKHLFIK